MPASGVRKEYSDVEWNNADLFFLSDTLRRGMPVDRVAGFLNRSTAEVRVKARELKVSIADDDVRPREERRPEISSAKLQPAEARQPVRGNLRSRVEFLAALQW